MSEERPRVWVYGVVSADAQLEQLESRDDLPEVWLVEAGDLAAIVGDVPEDDAKATRNQALAHSRVLETAVRDAPVLPFRFGIMCPTDNDVASGILEERHDQLADVLGRLEDVVQMVLKVYYDEEAVLREILEAEPEIAQLRDATRERPEAVTRNERVRLGELINNAILQRRERDSADLLESLESVVVGVDPQPPEKELMVVNAPFLVERARLEEFDQAVEEVAEERVERMHFKLLGPMPAYNFLGTEEPAAA